MFTAAFLVTAEEWKRPNDSMRHTHAMERRSAMQRNTVPMRATKRLLFEN